MEPRVVEAQEEGGMVRGREREEGGGSDGGLRSDGKAAPEKEGEKERKIGMQE